MAEFIGKAIAVCPMRSGTSSNGNEWQQQDYVFEDPNPRNPQYPERLVVGIFGADRIQQANVQLGGVYHIFFDHSAREYQGRWFGSNSAWKIEPHNAAVQPAPQPQPQAPFPPAPEPTGAASSPQAGTESGQVGDELPFD